MSCRTGQAESATAKEILRYFLRNPEAADSLEGIARWRLLDETIHRNLEEIAQALEWLVAQGFLLELRTAASGRVFRLKEEKRADAEGFLSAAGLP